MNPIQNFYNIVYLFDATMCCPNGSRIDNRPRIYAQTNTCYCTDVSIKGRVRDAWVHLYKNEPGMGVMLRSPDPMVTTEDRMGQIKGVIEASKSAKKSITQTAAELFVDVRNFGGVLSSGDTSTENLTGVLSMDHMVHSLNDVDVQEVQITRQMRNKNRKQKAKAGGVATEELERRGAQFGDTHFVNYAAFMAQMRLFPYRAEQTGFSDDDLAKLVVGLQYAWYYAAASVSKSGMKFRGMWIFKHPTDIPAIAMPLTEKLVKIQRYVPTEAQPYPLSFEDYKPAEVDTETIKKAGIKMIHISGNDPFLPPNFKLKW